MTRLDEAKRWWQQAYYDLKAVEWNYEGGFYDISCFLSQQAVEKALKALLYFLGVSRRLVLTHSVFELIREAAQHVRELGGFEEEARLLDLHYVPARYPNGLPAGYPHQFYTKATADQVHNAATRIFHAVGEYLAQKGLTIKE